MLTLGWVMGVEGMQIMLLWRLFHGAPLATFLLWHSAGSVLWTLLYATVAGKQGAALLSRICFVGLMLYAIPVFGALLLPVEQLVQRWADGPQRRRQLIEVQRPSFDNRLIAQAAPVEDSLLAQANLAPGAPNSRISGLLVLNALPLRQSSPMLTQLMLDPEDEIRLLAYGTYNRAERSIMNDIYALLEQLQHAPSGSAQAQSALPHWVRLAELYWELIYHQLVHGEMRNFTLQRVQHFAQRALAQDAHLAAMWYLLGRCALLEQRVEQAQQFLQQAQALHFPENRLIPWFAEVAFLQKRYHDIPALIRQLGVGTRLPTLLPVQRYWSS